MKNIQLLLLLCLCYGLARGQSLPGKERKNIFKVNILRPLLSTTGELSYERLLQPNLSIVLGTGANLSADQSDFQLNSEANLEFLDRDVRNIYYLAELRRYIPFCDCRSPHGFYAGGFIRYNQLDFSSSPQFRTETSLLNFNIDIDLRTLNFGPVVGYQINLNNWIIDFEFGGFGYAPNWIKLDSSTTLNKEILDSLSDALSRNFSFAGNYKKIDPNDLPGKISFWYWTVRYAVSVGYYF